MKNMKKQKILNNFFSVFLLSLGIISFSFAQPVPVPQKIIDFLEKPFVQNHSHCSDNNSDNNSDEEIKEDLKAHWAEKSLQLRMKLLKAKEQNKIPQFMEKVQNILQERSQQTLNKIEESPLLYDVAIIGAGISGMAVDRGLGPHVRKILIDGSETPSVFGRTKNFFLNTRGEFNLTGSPLLMEDLNPRTWKRKNDKGHFISAEDMGNYVLLNLLEMRSDLILGSPVEKIHYSSEKEPNHFVLTLASGMQIQAKKIVIATGMGGGALTNNSGLDAATKTLFQEALTKKTDSSLKWIEDYVADLPLSNSEYPKTTAVLGANPGGRIAVAGHLGIIPKNLPQQTVHGENFPLNSEEGSMDHLNPNPSADLFWFGQPFAQGITPFLRNFSLPEDMLASSIDQGKVHTIPEYASRVEKILEPQETETPPRKKWRIFYSPGNISQKQMRALESEITWAQYQLMGRKFVDPVAENKLLRMKQVYEERKALLDQFHQHPQATKENFVDVDQIVLATGYQRQPFKSLFAEDPLFNLETLQKQGDLFFAGIAGNQFAIIMSYDRGLALGKNLTEKILGPSPSSLSSLPYPEEFRQRLIKEAY